MFSVRVPLKKVVDDSYDIHIGRNLFDELITDLRAISGKVLVITDSKVKTLYGDKIPQEYTVYAFPEGEASKTRETKAQIEDFMIENGFGRDSFIVALGGGVVSDMAGFVAGTFGRGIPFVNYATTFLAAADASVGGKCAVDTPIATNLIGMFHQPQKVYIDIGTWATLDEHEIRCGFAETIKHACIADKEFFEFLEKNIDKRDYETLEYITIRNCEIKKDVVCRDEREEGLRQVLNLGHTVGRALEPLMDYQLSHGEAVAIGLACQVRISEDLGYLKREEGERILHLLTRCGLPTEIPEQVSKEDLIARMYTDKKVRNGEINFVLQEGIGRIKKNGDKYVSPISEDYLRKIL